MTNEYRIWHKPYTERNGTHAYDVEVKQAETGAIKLYANVVATNRSQAARIVEADGHEVRSINMVG